MPRMVSNLKPFALAVSIVCLVVATSEFAHGEGWPIDRGPAHEPAPFRYDPSQVKVLPRAFLEDAPACTLYSGTTHLLEADGSVETIVHEIIRFNGRKGIDRLGEYRSISYDPAYQKLTLNEARVLKAGGRRVEIEPKHVQLRDLSTDYQVYDHDKQLVISFPGLEVGDAIEVKWTTRGKNPEYQGHFFTRYTFGDDRYPVAVDELRLRLPRSRVLKFGAVNGKLDPVVKEDGDCRLYHWKVTDRPELPQDENLPSREELRLQVVLSTFASWDDVGKWKQALRRDCWKCTPEIQKIVREVTAWQKTPVDRARALTYWVRRHIRYVSLGTVTHDYRPHPPATVLANCYGDCKDQAQLLAVMLHEAGLQVALVTLGTRDDGQIMPTVPSPWGSHAILLVTIDGSRHWIDTTISQGPWDYLPRDDRDRMTYATDEKGLRLLRTPRLDATANRTEQTTYVTVSASGAVRCKRKAVFHGVAAVAQRETWSEVPPGERRRLMSAELQDNNSKAHLLRFGVDEAALRAPERDVVAAIDFEIPAHFSGNPDLEGSFTDSKVWSRLLGYTLDYDRQAPLDLGSPFESIHRYVIRLPASLRFESLPKDRSIVSKWGSFQVAVLPDSKDARAFALEFRTRLDKTRVEVADFAEFRKFHEAVNKDWRAWITLKPTESLADAPYLEALLLLSPQDADSAAILARLYCNGSKYPEARRVLTWARFLHPRNRQLWELTVRAAAGLKDEEAAYEEMVRRFPTHFKYAVELGTVRVKKGDYSGARTILELLASKAPPAFRAQAHYQLARVAFLLKQPAKAFEHWEAAARADSESVGSTRALQFKARVYEKLGKPQEAMAAFRQALKIDADAERALIALIRLELAAGQRAEALDHLRRYTVLVGEDMQGLVRAADYHLSMGRYEDALDLAVRALDIRFDVSAQRVLGLVYAQRGDHERAVAALARAEKTPAVFEALIHGNIALGRLREAIKQAEASKGDKNPTAGLKSARATVELLKQRREAILKQVRISTAKAEACAAAIDTYVCAEHFQEARAGSLDFGVRRMQKLLNGAFAGGIEIGPAYGLRGLLMLEHGNLTKALADAEKAIVLSPQDARAFFVRGRVRFERVEAGAVTDLTRAAELTRRADAAILQALAAALWREHRREDALTALREAVKLRPKDVEIAEQLKEMERATKVSKEARR
jgi:tetratricopeptide (TPR) repeat protein